MSDKIDLETCLDTWAGRDSTRRAVAQTLIHIASACVKISGLLLGGALSVPLSETTGKRVGVDMQKKIDVIANDIIVDTLQLAPVAAIATEELDDAILVHEQAPLCVAIDPIDGSSNAEVNAPVGTIFSVLPYDGAAPGKKLNDAFLRSGLDQRAAGFFVYGPQTILALTVGDGTHIFTLDPADGRLKRTDRSVQIPAVTAEYAINASNYRHWDQPIRTYFSDCNRGREGPRAKDFNMRWTASPIADIFRILKRGGIFLYPGDLRPGYKDGRLRVTYEANPLAFVIEQAGGAASTGHERMLEVQPIALHQHIPFIAGSREEVAYIMRLHNEPHADGERSPLFRQRGLFRS